MSGSDSYVTDKKYYLDPLLKIDLDKCIERQKKKWDTLLIIDGDEGAGKTTFSWGIAYYWAYATGKKFTIDNIFFDPDELYKFATDTKQQVIVWDEAVLGALSNEWQSQSQKKLIKILMTCRSKNHFLIFLIPKFYKLAEYIAIDRAYFLINVYSPDGLRRGYYCLYNQKKKEMLYNTYKSNKKKMYHWYNYKGTFPKGYANIIDEDAYNKKKDTAVSAIMDTNRPDDKYKKEIQKLKYKIYLLAMESNFTLQEAGNITGFQKKTINMWKRYANDEDIQVLG